MSIISRLINALSFSRRQAAQVHANVELKAETPQFGPIVTPHHEITPDIVRYADAMAKELDVRPEIHPMDLIFWHVADSRQSEDVSGAVREYFESGKVSALEIKNAYLSKVGQEPKNILDFASGYCRVTRHLCYQFPNAILYTSDIHDAANNFSCSLGFHVIASTWDPSQYKPRIKFDLIVAISFFTHMPKRTWQNWLQALGDALSDKGVILFTTHGAPAMVPMGLTEVDEDGFAHHPHTEQYDLDINEYASTTTLYNFVEAAVTQSGLDVIAFKESGFGYQDLYIVGRQGAVRNMA
jgi:SAM-dependent methyltransferase